MPKYPKRLFIVCQECGEYLWHDRLKAVRYTCKCGSKFCDEDIKWVEGLRKGGRQMPPLRLSPNGARMEPQAARAERKEMASQPWL